MLYKAHQITNRYYQSIQSGKLKKLMKNKIEAMLHGMAVSFS